MTSNGMEEKDSAEMKELLKANYELSKENNKLLKNVRSVQKRAALSSIVRWLFLLIVAFGLYYYIEPYFAKIVDIYNKVPILGSLDMEAFNKFLTTFK